MIDNTTYERFLTTPIKKSYPIKEDITDGAHEKTLLSWMQHYGVSSGDNSWHEKAALVMVDF